MASLASRSWGFDVFLQVPWAAWWAELQSTAAILAAQSLASLVAGRSLLGVATLATLAPLLPPVSSVLQYL